MSLPNDAIGNAPDWLLGRIRWRGWQLPLVSFARLSGIADEQGGLGSKVIVLKALGPAAPRMAEQAAEQLLYFFTGVAKQAHAKPDQAEALLAPAKK